MVEIIREYREGRIPREEFVRRFRLMQSHGQIPHSLQTGCDEDGTRFEFRGVTATVLDGWIYAAGYRFRTMAACVDWINQANAERF